MEPVGRGGRLLLRRAAPAPTASGSRCGCARWSGCCRSSRAEVLEPSTIAAAARLRRPACAGSCATARNWCGDVFAPDATGAGERQAAARWSARSGCGGCWRGCSTPRSSCPRTASARCRGATASAGHAGPGGPAPHRRATSRRSRPPGCSAATPTGAARCGSRSTTCSWRRCARYDRYYGDGPQGRDPDRIRSHPSDLRAVADDLADGLIALFLRGPDGRRPVDGEPTQSRRRPAVARSPHVPEYFHGDTGDGLGASHQTGWTALVATLIEQQSQPVRRRRRPAG